MIFRIELKEEVLQPEKLKEEIEKIYSGCDESEGGCPIRSQRDDSRGSQED